MPRRRNPRRRRRRRPAATAGLLARPPARADPPPHRTTKPLVPNLDPIRPLLQLCQVLDAAEFCRNVHSLPEWRAAAERVCVELGAYTQTLNTHYALYTALAAALPPPDPAPSARGPPPPPPAGAPAAAGWDQETVLVGRLLLRDFERYGVHLSGPAQDRMGALMAESQVLGMRFTQNLADPAACGAAALPPAAVARLPHHLQRLFRRVPGSNGGGREGALSAAGTSRTLSALLAGAGDEAVRREAYRVYCAHPAANADVLEQLLAARREMAALMGYQSFAAYQLQGFSLAARPQAVAQFLAGLGAAVAPAAQAEAAQLRELKRRLGGRAAAAPPSSHSSSAFDGRGGAAPAALRPWDRDWLLGAAREGHPGDEAARALCAYLTVDGCIRGLSELLRRLMRVSLVEEAPAAGEAWAPGVRRLVARHEEEGPLGVVYLDLAPRPGKFPGAAHFTLRCGRAAAGGGYQVRARGGGGPEIMSYGWQTSSSPPPGANMRSAALP
jgi:intermediate peptidase